MSYQTVKKSCNCQKYDSFAEKQVIGNTANQIPPYYNLGPNIHISDKPIYIYTFPDQNYINGGPPPQLNYKMMPWFLTS